MKHLSAQKGILLWSTILLLILTKISNSQNLPAPYNFQAELMNGNPNQVLMSWDFDLDTTLGFQFFLSIRDSAVFGTSTSQAMAVSLNEFNQHCYWVAAHYTQGSSEWAGPLCGNVYPPPYNVEAVFNNDIVPIVDIWWDHDNYRVEYFEVWRDQYLLGTTTTHQFTDHSPAFENYCYNVFAVYDNGTSEPGGPACTFSQLYPEMVVEPLYLEQNLSYNDSSTIFYGIINMGGSVLWYETIGFTDTTAPPGFLKVGDWTGYPSGMIPGYGTLYNIPVRFFSAGYGPGTHYQDMVVVGNDPDNPVENVPCIMHVGPQAYLEGNILDALNNEPLYGVTINTGTQHDKTDTNGYYAFNILADSTFNVSFTKAGYESLVIPVTTGSAPNYILLDTSLIQQSLGLNWVIAEVLDCNDPAPAMVNWTAPEYYDELIYDADLCTDFHAWDFPGGEHAVKFTPDGYPAIINGGSFYVGRGVYPDGNWLNTDLAVLVYDEGPDGMPGNVLDSATAVVSDCGWVGCYFGYDAQIDSGSFFISVVQKNLFPDTPPIGVDGYQSQLNYSYSKPPAGTWDTAGFRNFMIRAEIFFESGDNTSGYVVSRASDFDPWIGPQFGTLTILDTVTELNFTDSSFEFVEEAWFCFAVSPITNGQPGQYAYSNIIGHDMGKIVTFQVEDCNGNSIDSVEITMVGMDYPAERFSYPEQPQWTFGFDCVWKGMYDITVTAQGFDPVQFDAQILSDTTFFFMFDSTIYPVSNLWVDTITTTAYWDAPLDTSNVLDYSVYLDGSYSGNTDSTYYQFMNIPFDQHTVCVEANYACGPATPVCTNFGGGYLLAPDWITADSIGNDALITWYMDTSGFDDEILGFKLYRDSIYFKYIEYLPGLDTFTWLDTNLVPMCYDYHVSAFYTLEPFGYYMQFGDSELTGPAEVCLVAGNTLPIFEDWSSGSFGSFWNAEGNWRVNGQYGNPYPSVEFTWDPVFDDYQFSLASDYIDGIYMDSTRQEYLDGKFLLIFDLKLDDNSSSGEEYFNAEVWSEGTWHTVFSTDNSNGSFDWTTESIDISDYALGYIFRLRFKVVGENTQNILSWFLDNIEVYHYCASPYDLNYDPLGYNMCVLTWHSPSEEDKGVEGYNLYLSFDAEPYQFLDHTSDTTYTYEFSEYGDYYFYVTALYESCESDGSNEIWIQYYDPIGIEDMNGVETINIFPIPSRGLINVESTIDISSLCILDLSGRELHCKENIHKKKYELNVSAYDPGVYLLRIETPQGRAIRKIIISR